MDILAKSDGTTLIDHSNNVSQVSIMIYRELTKNISLQQNHLLVLEIAGKLHDIGKCTKNFQNKLKKNHPEEDIFDVISRIPYRHNEVGWAFLSKYLQLPNEILTLVLDLVYWHHGISNKLGGYNNFELLSKIPNTDIEIMVEYLKSVIDEEYINPTPELANTRNAPTYYSNDPDTSSDKNMYLLTLRASLNSADRLCSMTGNKQLSIDDVKSMIFNDDFDTNLIDITKHEYFGNERFQLQQSISNITKETTIIKAPAGFGKTLLGLLWMISQKKKILWVCPRNVVAISVFKTITQELKAFGANNVSVEVYVTGEVSMSTHNSNGFESDIIITNIDNFLAPSVDNRHGNRICDILNFPVVFDEWHEFVSDTAMFSCFINIMRVRHRLTGSKTILLSATPIPINGFWDTIKSQTLILPNKDSHYPAPHKIPYKLNIVDDLSAPDNSSTLIIYNSIQNVQLNKTNSSNIIHSGYVDSDRNIKLNEIYQLYGKQSKRTNNKPNLYSGPLIRASLDISFQHLYESIVSPQYTLQAIGRCNRFGDYNDQCTINLSNQFDLGENNLKDILYSRNFTGTWFDFIKQYHGHDVTLDELYVLYNKFENTNQNTLIGYYKSKHHNSLTNLSKIHPIKYYNKKVKSDVKTIGSNKLRILNDGLFVIAKNNNQKTYCDPFSVEIYGGISEQFKERDYDVNIGKIISVMKELRNTNDTRFDYNNIIDDSYHTMDDIRKAAKKSNTPYIRFDAVYDQTYGLIKHTTLYKIFPK